MCKILASGGFAPWAPTRAPPWTHWGPPSGPQTPCLKVLPHQKYPGYAPAAGGHVTMTFDLLTPKIYRCLPFFILHLCMKYVGRTLFELSRYNKVWTDRQTDRRTDRVITIGLPHLRWRGPNYKYVKGQHF